MKPPNSLSRFRHPISRYRGLVALAFSLCLCGALAQPTQGWPEELESLQEEARAMARPVLLVFSGSDWCGPCIRLQREVLTDPAFVQFAAEELLVVTADFPRKK
ncbi:MAG: thioredoxin family protein, partial [Saprospiraceae bacterium]|nr:thioredoxin family protein [Saprospiraceae bacterium]